MNKPHFLQKLAPVGVVVLSAIAGITTMRSAQAATVYGFSKAEINNLVVDFNGITGVTFGTDTSASASLSGATGCANQNVTDTLQCFVTNNDVDPADQNRFNPPLGIPGGGTAGTNFSRSDALVNGDPLVGFNGFNVAEGYINSNEIFNEASSDGEWELVSSIFEANAGDSVDITFDGLYELIVETVDGDDTDFFVDAEFEFAIEINDSSGNDLFDTEFARLIGTIDPDVREESGMNFDESNLTNGSSFTFTEDGEYNIVISAFEQTASRKRIASVPEPASILGLLTVSGLGLALKRKKQS